jgi:DNA-binding MarR family transcriptional regulator
MLYKNARERIVNVLLNHISFTTQASKIPTVYNLKRNEIAELCGLRVETVVRMLRKLEKKKIIKRERNAIKIIDMKSMLNLKI